MTSKKKSKKNSKGKQKCEDESVTKYNPYMFFSNDEIGQIKAVLKIKEVLNIPIAIGCVILNKPELLEVTVKKGLNVNQYGPNNTTALIWAVRYKYLDMITVLLENGADPTAGVANGENTVIIALEHKLWDEPTFLAFWEKLERFSSIDANCTNKNGHTILHIAVRREWEVFINKLLTKNVDIDITNINGVTPLMTACFRNNSNIVNVLINKGADFTKEDNHHRTALCYAIVTGSKMSKNPFLVADRIVFELKKDLSFREYIKRRVNVISAIMSKEKMTDAEFEMVISVVHYIVQRTENGLKIFLDLKIFDTLNKAITKTTSKEKQKLIYLIIQELLCYNEQAINFSADVQLKLSNQFLNTNLINFCVEKIKNKESYYNLAVIVILFFCTSNEIGHKWVVEHHNDVKDFIKLQSNDLLLEEFQKELLDETRKKLIKKKMKKLRRYINALTIETNESADSVKNSDENRNESSFVLKKSKKRSKIMKAKIAKIKDMELTERVSIPASSKPEKIDKKDSQDSVQTVQVSNPVNEIRNVEKRDDIIPNELYVVEADKVKLCQTGFPVTVTNSTSDQPDKDFTLFSEAENTKKLQENKQMFNPDKDGNKFLPCYKDIFEANPITNSLKAFLINQEHQPSDVSQQEPISQSGDWKSKILNLPFNDWSIFSDTLKINKKEAKHAIQFLKKVANNQDNTYNIFHIDGALNTVMDYLKELIGIILARSKSIRNQFQATLEKNTKTSNISEKQMVTELQANFQQLISSILSLAHTNLPEALRNIYRLESTMLKYPVRGRTLLADMCALEQVKMRITTTSFSGEASYLSYIENSLNGFEEAREDIKITVLDNYPAVYENEPSGLYEMEMDMLSPEQPKNKQKLLEGKLNTMKNAYHLVNSIEKLIDEDDDDDDDDKPTVDPFFKADLPDIEKYCEPTEKYSDMVLKMLTKHVAGEKLEQSRWSDKIEHLQNAKNSTVLLGGDIRIGKFPERNQIISQGGNFNLVTLGISSDNEPLAVKRIPKEHSVCKILKALINPLLGLRHKHILHYFACDYDDNDLVLATPLCEYNISQYVLLLKENADKRPFNLNHIDIIRQFLNGLAYLHQQPEPIVHGNLKPSNIFVDVNGTVRLGEFGVSKALFKMIEAPKSSLVWVSQETFRMYKHANAIECSISSDIQVAGMLLYYIISGGVHPFGLDIETIVKNFEKYTMAFPPSRFSKNQIVADLLSWMLMYEPSDRPNIKQVLSHVLFWSGERKWRFILNCAGISFTGVPLNINVAKVHDIIEKMANKGQIKGHWVNIIRRKFPKIVFHFDDTVVGLLRFVRQFCDNERVTTADVNELKSCLLNYFPAFPLTLFRILEATPIIKEYPFVSYTMIETILS
ncbi:uncharacterized protein LOC143191856 isoform X2 [Rhynchophorus ferrugineus]|uniref:uncharacterized protein LOC143191856 isoform X2 n=1 Tax=Rhynchophorus ferrugineus TaxID=354439 RepID=UPI003FCCDA3A